MLNTTVWAPTKCGSILLSFLRLLVLQPEGRCLSINDRHSGADMTEQWGLVEVLSQDLILQIGRNVKTVEFLSRNLRSKLKTRECDCAPSLLRKGGVRKRSGS